MYTALILYIVEVVVCTGLFALTFSLLFKSSTHLRWMRYYLLLSLFLPLLLPFVPWFSISFESTSAVLPMREMGQTVSTNLSNWFYELPKSDHSGETAHIQLSLSVFAKMLFSIYITGVFYHLLTLLIRLYRIRLMVLHHHKEKREDYVLIWLERKAAPFSFLKYLFLSRECQSLTREELNQIIAHEQVHIRQRHSLDLLLLEGIKILFWVNPFLRYLRSQLQDVHEYLADEQVTKTGDQKAYAHLLLKMAALPMPVNLSAGFTARQIGRRIQMLNRNRSGKWSRLRFLSILPLSASLVFLFSCVEEVPEQLTDATSQVGVSTSALDNTQKIGSIMWEGNQLYTDAQLNEIFGLKSGDVYDSATVAEQLNYHPDRTTISDLYMDQGYLFFSIEVKTQERTDSVIDIQLNIFEGKPNHLGDITVRGNKSMSTEEILRKIDMESGELFNRSKLIGAQRTIAELGYFDPQNVRMNPIPKHDEDVVDIEFVLEEINE